MRGDGCAAPPVLGLLFFPFSRPLRAGLTYAAPPALVFPRPNDVERWEYTGRD
jgi:hypothetical protein